MFLRSRDGITVEITPVGYEFASGPAQDLSWLEVRIAVTRPHGECWEVVRPCLTIAEGARLVRWLTTPRLERIEFVEPLVALRRVPPGEVEESDVVEVTFSHESLPPSMRVGPLRDWLGGTHSLWLRIEQGGLDAAADRLDDELHAFGPRPASRRPLVRRLRLWWAGYRLRRALRG